MLWSQSISWFCDSLYFFFFCLFICFMKNVFQRMLIGESRSAIIVCVWFLGFVSFDWSFVRRSVPGGEALGWRARMEFGFVRKISNSFPSSAYTLLVKMGYFWEKQNLVRNQLNNEKKVLDTKQKKIWAVIITWIWWEIYTTFLITLLGISDEKLSPPMLNTGMFVREAFLQLQKKHFRVTEEGKLIFSSLIVRNNNNN